MLKLCLMSSSHEKQAFQHAGLLEAGALLGVVWALVLL